MALDVCSENISCVAYYVLYCCDIKKGGKILVWKIRTIVFCLIPLLILMRRKLWIIFRRSRGRQWWRVIDKETCAKLLTDNVQYTKMWTGEGRTRQGIVGKKWVKIKEDLRRRYRTVRWSKTRIYKRRINK